MHVSFLPQQTRLKSSGKWSGTLSFILCPLLFPLSFMNIPDKFGDQTAFVIPEATNFFVPSLVIPLNIQEMGGCSRILGLFCNPCEQTRLLMT